MADIARACSKTGDIGVRLLTQDPGYSDETKDAPRKIGFEVVGEHGSGGFTEFDDQSIVFSVFAAAPVKQIIADLARSVAIICASNTSTGVLSNLRNKLDADSESPRTKQMWKEYESWKFPAPSEGAKLESSLHQLEYMLEPKSKYGECDRPESVYTE
ncbi:hypothetical protein F5B18DRAFT_653149 [Nemania serpens]|nr:hypothetical protein F5B18DRAFT_653149 [Nemania serpens]